MGNIHCDQRDSGTMNFIRDGRRNPLVNLKFDDQIDRWRTNSSAFCTAVPASYLLSKTSKSTPAEAAAAAKLSRTASEGNPDSGTTHRGLEPTVRLLVRSESIQNGNVSLK